MMTQKKVPKNTGRRIAIIILMTAVLISSIGCSSKANATIIAEKSLYDFTTKISEDNMMATINTLAGKDNARVSGFDGEHKSAELIKKQFESYGFKTSTTDFPVDAYLCNSVALNVLKGATLKMDKVNAVGYSNATPKEGIKAEVVSISMGDVDAYKDKDVNGKIVLIQRGGEKFIHKANRAKDMGAVAVIFYDPKAEGDGSMFASFGVNTTIPGVCIPKEDAFKLETVLSEGKSVEVNLLVDSITKASKSQNIFGLYESANNPDKKQIIISAHYDGVDTPAANDNASGVATILEIARVLSTEKVALPYDIYFMAFGSEETGLIGSSNYAYSLDSATIKRTLAVFNFDMVGVGDTINFCTANGQSSVSIQQQLLAFGERMGIEPVIQEMENSDHTPLAYAGIPAITYYVSEDSHYHTDLDTPDRIQPEMLAKACNYGLTVCTEFVEEKK